MTSSRSTAAVAPESRVCTVCPLLCEDVVVTAGGVIRACAAGAAAFGRLGSEAATAATGAGAARDTAIDRAAALITAARRVLVTGLADATLEGITTALDLAEAVGAAVDIGGSETSQVSGPTIARAGEVTAEWEELRDRADLVVFWFCDPSATHPRFIERFVTPPTPGKMPRRTIAIGVEPVLPASSTHRHAVLPLAAAIDAARLIEAAVAGIRGGPLRADDEAIAAGAEVVADAIAAAECVAIVTTRGADPIGLGPWSTALLVRAITHAKPAFEIPLAGGIDGGANLAGAAAICTWRYGAAGGIARADRGGGPFLPAECDAVRLIDRGEVDCVVAVGRLSPFVEAAVARRAATIGLVRIASGDAASADPARPSIRLGCRSLLASRSGTLLRGDGRRIVLGPGLAADDDSMAAVLADLVARVQACLQTRRGPT
ncbi:MAG: hypothetical protein K8S94_00730 [Planctomycetia bacterium]|nr:hypothetical protein [Planctomycetia bacterium]